MTEEQQQARHKLVGQIGWRNAWSAEQLIKDKLFTSLTYEQLQKRRNTVYEALGGAPVYLSADVRIDDDFIEWEKRYGAECRALEYLIANARQRT